MRTSNPVLSDKAFDSEKSFNSGVIKSSSSGSMTIGGTINRIFLLLVFVMASAGFTWYYVSDMQYLTIATIVGSIGGLIFALITIFKKEWAPVTSIVYALFEGVFLGAISLIFEMYYPGIVLSAIGLTFCVLAMMLLIYRTRIIKVTDRFRLGVASATMGIFLLYLVSFILRLFGVNIPFIHESGLIGIIFSIIVVVIASLNLVLDFDFIERASASENLPKYMEWYAAFGLIVTLIWLYLEILRLLSKIRDR